MRSLHSWLVALSHWTYTESFFSSVPSSVHWGLLPVQYPWSPHPTKIWKWGEDWISISPRQKRKSVFSLHPSWNSAQFLGHCIESYCPPLTLHCHCKGRCPSFKLGAAFFQRALHCGRRPCLWPRARCPRARGERNGAGDLPIMANP